MADSYFAERQKDILDYKEYLSKNNMVIDKTNKMFLDLILNILEYLGTENPDKLDEECEYNILTMKNELENVIYNKITNEKAEYTLLTFCLRIAKEMEVKYNKIENNYLKELYTIMTSKGYKYPSYVKDQQEFALEKMPSNIARMDIFR